MRIRSIVVSSMLCYALLALAAAPTPANDKSPEPSADGATKAAVTGIALPGAPADGVGLDYLAVDRSRHRVWVPAGGTGNTVVIDTKTQEVRKVEKFPTKEVERQGKKRMVGPSSATIGDGFVYIGNRGDDSVCAINAASLERGGCVNLPSMPDGVAYVGRTKEVWVTTPRDSSIAILDVSKPSAPKLAGTIKLDGGPEGYAVDDKRGLFYTNLEDANKTLRIDAAKRSVTASWLPGCDDKGPAGLAIDTAAQELMVVCSGHVAVLDTAHDGKVLSTLETGQGVDNLDYLPARHALYAAAGGSATLTVARLDDKGVLHATATIDTATRARNAVADDEGTAYIGVGPEGKVLVVKLAKE